MSIRLRLTLLYSVILALTLIAFSSTVYFIQARVTYDSLTTILSHQADEVMARERRVPRRTSPASSPLNLPGRWTEMRSSDGTVTGRSPDMGDSVLPLSHAGLLAMQSGKEWTETAVVQGEDLLIYGEPVMSGERVIGIIQVATPISERDQSLATLRLILIIVDLFAILVAFLIGWLLSGTALSPIHRMTQTARDIGARRDFARRVENRGPNDEIGQLAVTFNSMLTELESAYRQVQQALQIQRRFVADASHELRTPLTTIRGNIELLEKEPPLAAADEREILTETKDEADRLIRLVNQLLVLARADARRPLRRDPVAIKPLVDDVYRQARLMSPMRRIECDAQVDATVEGDRDAIKQVLLILVDNALTHTPPNAALSLATFTDDGHVSVRIRDTGPGIPGTFLPHIFERFARGDASRSGPGAGLGLSIAKELVEAQSGALTATSEVGAGSTFTVTLPRSSQ